MADKMRRFKAVCIKHHVFTNREKIQRPMYFFYMRLNPGYLVSSKTWICLKIWRAAWFFFTFHFNILILWRQSLRISVLNINSYSLLKLVRKYQLITLVEGKQFRGQRKHKFQNDNAYSTYFFKICISW